VFANKSRRAALSIAIRAFRKDILADVSPQVPLRQGEHLDLVGVHGGKVVDSSGTTAVLESATPLQTDDGHGNLTPVDLNLVDHGSGIATRNAPLPVQVARDASDGVSFARSGLGVGLAQAAGSSSPSLVAGKAFFANVATNTDSWVSPTPGGADILLQIRAQDSPERIPLQFRVPDGAQLRMSADGSGGAEVVRGTDVLDKVAPPSAVDADGMSVPVRYTIQGNRLDVRVSHRAGDFLYPILVDPSIIEHWYWTDSSVGVGDAGWTAANTSSHGFAGVFLNGVLGPGLYVQSFASYYDNGDAGVWYYTPFRSKIYSPRADFQTQMRGGEFGSGASMCEFGWISGYPAYAKTNCLAYGDGRWDTTWTDLNCGWVCGNHDNVPTFGLEAYGTGARSTSAYTYLMRSAIYLWSRDGPSVSGLNFGTRPWTQHDSVTLGSAGEPGSIGMGSVQVTAPNQPSWPGFSSSVAPGACDGTRFSPCPETLPPPGTNWTIHDTDPGLASVEGVIPIAASATDYMTLSASDSIGSLRIDQHAPDQGSLTIDGAPAGDWVAEGQHDVAHSPTDPLSGVKSDVVALAGAAVARDTFSRSGVGWGTADSGGDWRIDSAQAPTDFSTDGSSGKIVSPSGQAQTTDLSSVTTRDSDQRLSITPQNVTLGGGTGPSVDAYLLSRFTSAASHDKIGLRITGDGKVWLRGQTGAGESVFPDFDTGLSYTPGATYNLRARVTGTGPTSIDAKLWRSGSPEPPDWMVSTTSSVGPQSGGHPGVLTTGFSASPPTVSVDDLRVSDLGSLTQATYAPSCDAGSGCPNAPGSRGFTWDATNAEEGQHRITIQTADPAGNSVSHDWDVGVDRSPPQITKVAGDAATEGALLNAGPHDVFVDATDQYSGVATIELTVDGQPVTADTSPDCVASACFSWDSTNVDNGPHTFRLAVTDRVGHRATRAWAVTVDHDPPELSLSGSLWTRAEGPATRSTYDLTASATDGDSSTDPQSGVADIEIQVDGQRVDYGSQTCNGGSCGLSRSWTFDASAYSAGLHRISVIAHDLLGQDTQENWRIKVVHPPPTEPPSSTPLSDAAAVKVTGAAVGDKAGTSVATLGDINGDGIVDYAIGAPFSDRNGRADSGTVYVVFGRSDAAGPSDLAAFTLNDGFRIDGAGSGDLAGTAVVAAGDVNGDGLNDLLVGAPRTGLISSGFAVGGRAYVVFGSTSAPTDIDLAQLGSRGFEIDGPINAPPPAVSLTPAPKTFGSALGAMSSPDLTSLPMDVNQDGLADIVLGASDQSNNGRVQSGSAYVVYGKPDSASVDVTNLGTGGFRIDGAAAGNEAGYAVTIPGDVNGDGTADLVVSAPGANAAGRVDGGIAFVIFGGATGNIDLAALGSNGYTVSGGSTDRIGATVAAAGDQNGDGEDDVVIGGHGAFVIYGQAETTPIDLGASSLPGYRVEAPSPLTDQAIAATATQDVNGDLIPDIVLGSANPGGDGTAWVVYGQEAGVTRNLGALGGEQGYAMTGPSGEAAGTSIDALGGGSARFLVGAPAAASTRGAVYVGSHSSQATCQGVPPPNGGDPGIDTSVYCDDFSGWTYGDPPEESAADTSPTGSTVHVAKTRTSADDIQCRPQNDFHCSYNHLQQYGNVVDNRWQPVGAVHMVANMNFNGTRSRSNSSLTWSVRDGAPNPLIKQELYLDCRIDVPHTTDRFCDDELSAGRQASHYNTGGLRLPDKGDVIGGPFSNERGTRGKYGSFNFWMRALGYPNPSRSDGRWHPPGHAIHTPRFNCRPNCKFH
jgi:hypothetical protein